ncbi:unnamed protein product [Bursaphelenchus xylophilus]|uniref:(pine wood nematode) hypothetical protein n=1 Tax=Bursaphelenchus xylophilus TaxID=6326 RepID=A0A1I7S6E9_BURXY|nr:unnamed protein product [Bursaphelenchus xylophilus]CAG9128060.1 unnamed protein product [Bursaphelenchus xylophilus]
MFYAQFVLAKKSALSQIWLAAHMERKLSKAQVFETDVSNAVNEILQPKSKMSLRTTGHLLLGIVRIFSKKTKYVLADCNEAFVRIKQAFQPGSAELAMLQNAVRKDRNTSELDLIDEMDVIMPDISEFDYAPAPMQQSRIDDITLQEDNFELGGGGLINEDLMDDEFDDCASNFDEEFERTKKNYELLNKNVSDDIELSRRSVSFLSDHDVQSEAAASIHKDGSVAASDENENHIDNEFDDYDSGDVMEVDQPRVEDDLVLAPLTNHTPEKEPQRQKRRRKLVWDDANVISAEEIRDCLSDYSDTMQPLELAPPTKRLMKIKEIGVMEHIYSYPATDIYLNKNLNKMYQRHLVPKLRDNGEQTAFDIRTQLGMSDAIDDDDNVDESSHSDLPAVFEENSLDQGLEDYPEDDEPRENGVPETNGKSSPKKRYEEEEDDEEDHAVDNDDQVFSKRTLGVLSSISTKFKTNDNHIILDDLLSNKATTKTRAQKFYALLELHKAHVIDIDQLEAYGPISIKPGQQLDEFLKTH